jgi:hypothetical protein
MKASELKQSNYPNFPEFKKWGIDLSNVDAALILALQSIRTTYGIPITPSPLQDAWSRTTGSKTSRHYAVGRLSDAGDVFPEREKILDLWLQVQELDYIGGIGLYVDTKGPDGKPWPMMHIDLRPNRLLWTSDVVYKERKYYYFKQDYFWEIVGRITGGYY